MTSAHAVICGIADPINRAHTCTLDDGHEGAHTDDTDPGRRWYDLASHGVVR